MADARQLKASGGQKIESLCKVDDLLLRASFLVQLF